MARNYRLVPVRHPDGMAHIRMVAPNGEIVMTSENYQSLENAKRAARKIIENGGDTFCLSPTVSSLDYVPSTVWHQRRPK